MAISWGTPPACTSADLLPLPPQTVISDEPGIALFYGRESKDYPHALAHQLRTAIETAAAEDHVIPESPLYRYADNDRTGKNSDREDFQRLLNNVASGQTRAARLYVLDRSRFGRWDDSRMHFYYEIVLLEHGITVRYCDEELFDHASDVGSAVKSHIANIAVAQERRKVVERGRKGKRDAFIDGSFPGAMVPYGTERWLMDKHTGEWIAPFPHGGARPRGTLIRPRWRAPESQVVRLIFDLLEGGHSLMAAARELERRKHPSPSGKIRWHPTIIRKVAGNPIYYGDYIWGSEAGGDPVHYTVAQAAASHPILYPDFAPGAPVSREQFDRVQDILAGNRIAWERRRPMKRRYLLSGLLVCAQCGVTFHGHRGTHYRHDQGSAVARVVRELFGEERPQCTCRPYLRLEEMERTIRDAVRSVVLAPGFPELVNRAVEDRLGGTTADAISREIDELKTAADRERKEAGKAAEAAAGASSETERSLHTAVVRKRAQQIEVLEQRIVELGHERHRVESLTQTALIPDLSDVAAAFDSLSHDELKELIAAVVHHVEVDVESGEMLIVCRTNFTTPTPSHA